MWARGEKSAAVPTLETRGWGTLRVFFGGDWALVCEITRGKNPHAKATCGPPELVLRLIVGGVARRQARNDSEHNATQG